MAGIDRFIKFCIDPVEHLKWKNGIAEYRNTMLLLQKKTELSNNKVRRFQQYVNVFFVPWVSLLLHEGVTNYICKLSA